MARIGMPQPGRRLLNGRLGLGSRRSLRCRHNWLRALLLAVVMAPTPEPVNGQDIRRFFPARALLPRLVAAPREPATAAKLVFPLQSPSRFGEVAEGEADLGISVPVLLLAGTPPGDVIVLGVEGGVFARFNLESKERDLITSDWVFMLPLVVHRNRHWFQVRYFHTSAHLGDEYLERFDVKRIPYARDALEATGYLSAAARLGFYVGTRWSFRVDPPEHKRWVLRAGAEFEESGERSVRAFIAGDTEFDQQYGWDPRVNIQAGVRVYAPRDRPAIRIVVELLTGPSPQGQFGGAHTSHVSLGIIVQL